MSRLSVFDAGAKVIAKTFMGPLPGRTIHPGMKGEVLDRDIITHRHKVRFENGRELWATADQVKLDPDCVSKEIPKPSPDSQ